MVSVVSFMISVFCDFFLFDLQFFLTLVHAHAIFLWSCIVIGFHGLLLICLLFFPFII